uniref:Biogenesis of lysosome-related organelles complex 1 subunit 5 n=1 Tax=Syphacia muris TaxID=451379 RepID=A0A0N5AGV9_9BILA
MVQNILESPNLESSSLFSNEFKKLLISEMQLALINFFRGKENDSQDIEEAIGCDAKSLCQLKYLAADAEHEVVDKFVKLAEMLSVIESEVDERQLSDAKKFFEMKSEVTKLRTKLQPLIAKYGVDLESSIAAYNDGAEELNKLRSELEELESQNDALREKLASY